MLYGLKFYSKDCAVVLKTGYDWVARSWCRTHTIHLDNGERVIGYKSRIAPKYASHYDF